MYVFGASGHAKVVIESLLSTNTPIEGVFDDNPTKDKIYDIPVLGTYSSAYDHATLIVAIGNNSIRENIVNRLNCHFGNALHKSATISDTAQLGVGIAIMAGVAINAETTVGSHSIINTNASVDHDCAIDEFVHIAPNATLCGGVHIGKGTLVGAGSVIIPNIKIGEYVTIGAGTVITNNIPDGVSVVRHNKIIK